MLKIAVHINCNASIHERTCTAKTDLLARKLLHICHSLCVKVKLPLCLTERHTIKTYPVQVKLSLCLTKYHAVKLYPFQV